MIKKIKIKGANSAFEGTYFFNTNLTNIKFKDYEFLVIFDNKRELWLKGDDTDMEGLVLFLNGDSFETTVYISNYRYFEDD